MIRFPQYQDQQRQPVGPDIAAQYQPPQFMNIQHAQMDQQQGNGGGAASGALNLGAALLAKYGGGGAMQKKLVDAPLRQDMMPMRRMGGATGGDYA